MRDGGHDLLLDDQKAYLLLALISFRAKRIDDENEFRTAHLKINPA